MGSDKRRYDITMSRRTRKPLKVRDENKNSPLECPPRGDAHKNEQNERKTLKELFDGEETTKAVSSGDESGKERNSLRQYFTEGEKQLQLVGVQQKEDLLGLKLKTMVNRYAKVLGYLMKKDRDPSLRNSKKKPIPKLIF